MHELAERLLAHLRRDQMLCAGDRVGVAVSGGADSVALLRLLLEAKTELGVVLSVVHVNHRLRGPASDQDEQFVAALAASHALPFHSTPADVAGHAARQRLSIETAARELRYQFYGRVLSSGLDRIATGHTLNDQAETVLMRLLRGAGMRGLGGIHPHLELDTDGDGPAGDIIRPLLGFRRAELEQYLRSIGQQWREDATNADLKFTRNRVRHLLLPLLEREFNPSIAQRLAELADIARAEEDYWANEAEGWKDTAVQWLSPELPSPSSGLVQLLPASPQALSSPEEASGDVPLGASMNLAWLLSEPLAVQRQVLRSIADEAGINLEFRHIEQILRLAESQSRGELDLPGYWKVASDGAILLFEPPAGDTLPPGDYSHDLPVPGRVFVPELDRTFEAALISLDHVVFPVARDQLLSPSSLTPLLTIRNWRPGDRFWPDHTREPRKVKELLQHAGVTGDPRRTWPVIVAGAEIVWLRGFPAATGFRCRPGDKQGVWIRELGPGDES